MSEVRARTIQIRTDLMISSNISDLVQKRPQMLVEATCLRNITERFAFVILGYNRIIVIIVYT